jgi:hypothetical protein
MASKGTPVGFKQLMAAAGPGKANRNRTAGSTWCAVNYQTSIIPIKRQRYGAWPKLVITMRPTPQSDRLSGISQALPGACCVTLFQIAPDSNQEIGELKKAVKHVSWHGSTVVMSRLHERAQPCSCLQLLQ